MGFDFEGFVVYVDCVFGVEGIRRYWGSVDNVFDVKVFVLLLGCFGFCFVVGLGC